MIANIEPKLTYERLKKEKVVRAVTPPVPWDPFMGMVFDTPHRRMEFYAEKLVCVDDAIAQYREPLEVPTEVVLVTDQRLTGAIGDQLGLDLEHGQQCLALVGFGTGQRERDRQAVQRAHQVQPQPPKEA